MTKVLLMFVSVLAANLLSNLFTSFVLARMRTEFTPAAATALAMLILVAVLLPLYSYLDTWTTALSRFLLRAGKQMLGRIVGLAVVFLAILMLLYYGYARLWFGINIYEVFFGSYI